MKITLRHANQVRITSLSDLQALIPDHMEGEVLNYGQGEGQIKVEDSVWGIYVDSLGDYSYTLEEGVLSCESALAIATGILHQVQSRWGAEIGSEVKGCHHDDPSMRLIT